MKELSKHMRTSEEEKSLLCKLYFSMEKHGAIFGSTWVPAL
jgi:hypothetical protein